MDDLDPDSILAAIGRYLVSKGFALRLTQSSNQLIVLANDQVVCFIGKMNRMIVMRRRLSRVFPRQSFEFELGSPTLLDDLVKAVRYLNQK